MSDEIKSPDRGTSKENSNVVSRRFVLRLAATAAGAAVLTAFGCAPGESSGKKKKDNNDASGAAAETPKPTTAPEKKAWYAVPLGEYEVQSGDNVSMIFGKFKSVAAEKGCEDKFTLMHIWYSNRDRKTLGDDGKQRPVMPDMNTIYPGDTLVINCYPNTP